MKLNFTNFRVLAYGLGMVSVRIMNMSVITTELNDFVGGHNYRRGIRVPTVGRKNQQKFPSHQSVSESDYARVCGTVKIAQSADANHPTTRRKYHLYTESKINFWLWPYTLEYTGSRLISAVKLVLA